MTENDAPFTAYNTVLLPRSRELRRKMTDSERHLWYDFLRNYPVKFYKQRSIEWFIVDFYCDAAKLAVELDGSQHYTEDGKLYDAERTAILNAYGIKVLRFSNLDVDKHFDGVCRLIEVTVTQRLKMLAAEKEAAEAEAFE